MMALLRGLLNLPDGASSIADGIDLLHIFVISVTMIMSTYVFATAAWFTIRYHRKSDDQLTAHVSASVGREVFLICLILGMFLLCWVLGFRQYIHMRDAPADADVVYVDAKQWMWKFAYPDGRASNDILTVPLGRPIKLVMTSRDVIHSFYVPAFRVKQDVLPGRYTTLWFEPTKDGTYPIWCAEYCGVSHSLMRGQVVVLPPAEYALWRANPASKLPPEADCGKGPGTCGGADLVSEGRRVAERRQCLPCHTLDGQRHIGPTWSKLWGSEVVLADGRHVIADDAYLTRSMMEPSIDVVAGYRDLMPTFQGTLAEPEVAALVELIRSLRNGAPPSPVALPEIDISGFTRDGGVSPLLGLGDGGTPP
jgi:cytochrome c oxidase subunit 2